MAKNPKELLKGSRPIGIALVILGLMIGTWAVSSFFGISGQASAEDPAAYTAETRKRLATVLQPLLAEGKFPEQIDVPDSGGVLEKTAIEYSIRPDLQAKAEQILKSYKPDYGAIVMMEAETGRILTLSSFIRNEDPRLRPFFSHPLPAASVFKIVTAATAIDKYQLSPESVVNFMGGHYTLYKRNVVGPQNERWSQKVTLREAFARSYNTAFGRLAIENLQPEDLLEYANRFGFNREIPTELTIPMSTTSMPDKSDSYHLAEMASGFNKVTLISAVQGAMIAGAVANQGILVAPTIVDRLQSTEEQPEVIFENMALPLQRVFSVETANSLKKMMHATIEIGTSRKSFQFFRKRRLLQSLDVGGKTGSLTAVDPKGKLDWFVGYIQDTGEKPVAIAVVTVHEKLWTVKSAVVAQQMFQSYLTFNDSPALKQRVPSGKPLRIRPRGGRRSAHR